MADTTTSDVKNLPFEKAIEELESIVKRLEEGKVPLEEFGRHLRARRSRSSGAARSSCGKPKRGSRRSPSTPPASPTGTEPLDVG